MAGNISGLHIFGPDTGPEALSLLDNNYTALTTALNTLTNFANSYLDSGVADAAVVTVAAPQVFALTDGVVLNVKIAATNATTTPTLNVNASGAHTIVNPDDSALVVGQIAGSGWALLQYNGGTGHWQLLSRSGTVASFSQITVGPPSGTNNPISVIVNASTSVGVDWASGLHHGQLRASSSGIFIGSSTADSVNLIVNGANTVQISTAGAVTVAAPSSGLALTVNASVSGVQAASFVGGSGVRGTVQFVDGQTGNRIWEVGSGVGAIGSFGIFDQTRGAVPFTITGGTGVVTINAPTAGTALNISTVAGGNGVAITVAGTAAPFVCSGGSSLTPILVANGANFSSTGAATPTLSANKPGANAGVIAWAQVVFNSIIGWMPIFGN